MSAVIDQDPVEADHAKVSRAKLLREAGREGEGVCGGALGG